jgi:hypothetical protein
VSREELARHIQEIDTELYRIAEEMKALEERGEGGPMIAALKERIAAVQRRQSEIVDQAKRLMGGRQ